jgi:hypothetical protein
VIETDVKEFKIGVKNEPHRSQLFCDGEETKTEMIEFKNWLDSSGRNGDEVVRRNPDEEILRLY